MKTKRVLVIFLALALVIGCALATASCGGVRDEENLHEGYEKPESGMTMGETEESLYEKYEKLELGMTMDEAEDILGKAEETEAKYFDDENTIAAGMTLATYGYINADFWYYRGEEYDKNVKADNEFDLEYEYLPYYQLRVTFNAEGKLVEAYFNTETEYFSLGDYGAGEDKKIKSVEYLDGAHEEGENKENAKLFFEDGSAYLGEVKFATDYFGEEYIDHPWGELVFDQK